jgi:glutamate dehydrogenase
MHLGEENQKESLIDSTVDVLMQRPELIKKDSAAIQRFVQSLCSHVPAELLARKGPDDLSSDVLELFHLAEQAIKGETSQGGNGHNRSLADQRSVWQAALSAALATKDAGKGGSAIGERIAASFPNSYLERFSPDVAARDLELIERVTHADGIVVSVSTDKDNELRLKTFRHGEPVALSDVLPMLENLGLRVVNEIPFEIHPADAAEPVWIQDFQALAAGTGTVDLAAAAPRMEEALLQLWAGTVENDALNRLILVTDLTARDIVVLRAYAKFLRQSGSSFSNAYIAETLAMYPAIAQLLVRLFNTLFDPATPGDREAAGETARAQIVAALAAVSNLDRDRILRAFLLLIRKTLRTNFYQRDETGQPKSYLSIKLASQEIDLLPLPRPLFEIFVYSPRMEGCHLRGGKVARGGLRWSDRNEDFRTEILGLMKAQMVKNAVIVPTGSKGGFVVKRQPKEREALMVEVVACYRILMAGLLDLTDNIVGDRIVPPVEVVRRDPDDPFLVVAADKGTATFSDIANSVALERGFWLGDAYASGGSVGYDHKAMGITSKGAWEAVKRHFREIGTDIQTTDFSVVGVGDMSGDVFGNGMLLSKHIKLIGAFNHQHIFIDPDPDPAATWTERKRLFDMQRSSWTDYDKSVLSKGGAIYDRSAKSVTLSPEAQARLGLASPSLTPQELIQALLRQDVDLLWFGGIGTYVKASSERHGDAGDRANDSLRVDANMLRAKVVGEGANLAMTQRARIEYALAGGRLNTDAVDNSAGVDTSDHEVNIKIGVRHLMEADHIQEADRAAFLASLTDEVEALVLNHNYLQTLGLTLAEARAPLLLERQERLMRSLERQGRLNREVEFLPDEEAIRQRGAAKRGLTRPELSVLMAYAKNVLNDELQASDLPDAPELKDELLAYFPASMRAIAPEVLNGHRLRREILSTVIANDVINRMGATFTDTTQARTGRDSVAVARAFLIAREVFDLPAIWREIDALDNKVPATVQTRLLLAVRLIVDQAVRWFLLSGRGLDIGALTAEFRPGVRDLMGHVADLLPENERELFESRRAAYVADGAPPALAERIVVLNTLSTAMDIVQISRKSGRPLDEVARLYFEGGISFGLLTLRRQARVMPAGTQWQSLAADALIDDSYAQQREIVQQLLAEGDGVAREAWVGRRVGPGSQVQAMLTDIARTSPPDLAMLTVASRQIRAAAQ